MERDEDGRFVGVSEPIPFRDLLARIAHGYSWQAIADEYGVTRYSVKWRVRQMHRQLGVSDAAHAVNVGHRVGLITVCKPDCEFCLRVQ